MTNDRLDRDEVVERLVRLAERGPEIPLQGADRVKALTRPLWRAEARRRAAKRYAAWGVGLAAAAALIVFLILPRPVAERRDPIGRIEVATGSFVIAPPAERGVVSTGSTLSTGASSRAALRLASGVSLRLDAGTRLRLDSQRKLALHRGAVYVDSGGARELVEIATAHGVARDIGTQFELRSEEGSLTVRVREGAVALTTRRDELRIDSGHQLTIGRDGSRSRTSLSAQADAWSWIHSVAPPFDIEGRSVASFLTWFSRETGAPVRYESAEAERIATTTLLHGKLGELRPDEAPPLILPSAGLEARRDTDGTLVVGVMPQ